MSLARMIQGAPLARVAPLLLVLACGLHAQDANGETPDWLRRAQGALSAGEAEAARYSVNALKLKPMGAPENTQMALCLFWMGQFDDAARHTRRALAADGNALAALPVLAQRMPPGDVGPRLNQLALRAEADAELCFLTGALLLVNQDRHRALAFLVRAEELAGADGQAARLSGATGDRAVQRGIAGLRDGQWHDAARSFAFAALDAPGIAEHYTGLAIALAAARDYAAARRMLELAVARYEPDRLLAWVHALRPHEAAGTAGKALAGADAGASDLRLAALLLFAAGRYGAAGEAAVGVLVKDRLDRFAYDVKHYIETRGLKDAAPVNGDSPAGPPPDDATDKPQPTLDDARRHLRRSDFESALKALDPLVREGAEREVFRLLFVALVGRDSMDEAATALQVWWDKAPRDERTRLNALRDLFARAEQFDAWRQRVLAVRAASPNAAIPRLLNTYIELTRGRYVAAREDLVVAKIELGANEMVKALDRLLLEEGFRNDITPDGVPDEPTPRALQGQGDRAFKAGDWQGARRLYLRAAEADAGLPFLTVALLRCDFALGDYAGAYLRLVQLLDEQKVAGGDGRLQLPMVDAYSDAAAYAAHLEALRKTCHEGGANGGIKLDAGAWALYGALRFAEGAFKDAAFALQKWRDFTPDRQPNTGLLKLLETANRRIG
ncbi:MAG: hypothetical protein KF696_06500 [Planctomycetes bacterium]|nr:hypothetical protein [Planctomycetota bacterium]MCW8136531.1 hypothetical protein [Planctomycetota bacterium]